MSTVCPMPTGITPTEAHAKYLEVKKKMPGLTPAAWRKAAAQELGMDYNDFLSIWKQAQGKSKAVKLVADPKPTLPAALQPGPEMKIPMHPAKKAVINKTKGINELLDDIDSATDDLVKAINSGELSPSDVDEILNDMLTEYKGLVNVSDLNYKINVAKGKAKNAWKKYEEDLGVEDFGFLPDVDEALKSLDNWAATEATEATVDMSSKFADDVMDHIMTNQGPLNHDLAQTVYKKMKKDMPGGTPAQWRHAAADYLNVDYNDYLAAWKKTGTTPKSVKNAINTKPNPSTTTSASTQGKYTGKYVDADTVKGELAAAYGPGAQKQYIDLVYSDAGDQYTVAFPNSLFPTKEAKEAVAARLRSMGLDVQQSSSGKYVIKAHSAAKPKPKPVTPKAPTTTVTAGDLTTVTLPDGRVVWNTSSARSWSEKWYNTLNQSQRAAVKNYTGSGYHAINSSLRKGGNGGSYAGPLSSAMEEMTHSFTVFRGTSIPMNQFVKGEMWSDKGFMSTAITPGSAWSGVKFEIRITPGTRGAYVDPVSSHRGEMEFLIDKGTQFRVLEVDTRTNKVVLVAIPK